LSAVVEDQLIGHEAAIDFVAKSISLGRLCSTYLVSGSSGIGKRVLGRAAAKLILCQQAKGESACGQCGSCLQFSEGQHPRFSEKYFDLDKKSTESMVDIARSFIEEVYTLGGGGDHLIYLIPDFHRYSIQVQNALLKTLEEPPSGVVFFLTINDSTGVLDTISSRSQLINLSRLSQPELKRILQKRDDIPMDKLDLLLRLSEGRADLAINFATAPYQNLFKWSEQKLLKPDTDFITQAQELTTLAAELSLTEEQASAKPTDSQVNRIKTGAALLIFERLLLQKCFERSRNHFVAMQIFNTTVEELLQARHSVERSGHIGLGTEHYMSLAFSRLKQIMRYVTMPELEAPKPEEAIELTESK
jgi:DNA polymerase III delta prime subunit